MAKQDLTKKVIDNMACPAGKRYIYIMDSIVSGLGVQVTASGAKSYVVRYQYNGKRYCKAFASVDKLSLAAARARAKEIMALYITGKDPFAQKKTGNKLTLKQLFEAWKKWSKEHNVNESTVHTVHGTETGLRQYFDLSHKDAESLSYQDLVSFQNARIKAGIKTSSINRYVTGIKHIYRWGMSQGLISSGYKFPAVKKLSEAEISPRTHHLSGDDVEKLITAAMAIRSQKREYLKWFILFALNTGIRPASICGLVWRDIIRLDTDGGEIRLRAANIKTRKDVNLTISAEAAEILQTLEQRPHGPEDKIFTEKSAICVNIAIKNLMRKAGLPPEMSAYSLRHNYATSLYLAGASPTEIQIQMCHANYTTTQKYIHADYVHQKQVANLLRFGSQADLKTQSA